MFYGLLSVARHLSADQRRVLDGGADERSPDRRSPRRPSRNALFGERGELLVRLVVIVSLPSAVNACLLMASRVLFSISRDGLGIPVATRVNAAARRRSRWSRAALVALAFLATGTFKTIIAIAAFFFVADYTLSFIAVFVLRRREPDAPRPYRAFGHPWTTGFVLLGSLAFLSSAVIGDRRNSLYALGIVVVSYPVFRFDAADAGAGPFCRSISLQTVRSSRPSTCSSQASIR